MKKQVKPTWNGLDTFDVTTAGCLKRASLIGHKEMGTSDAELTVEEYVKEFEQRIKSRLAFLSMGIDSEIKHLEKKIASQNKKDD